jgi:hypothetical protein
MRIDGSKAYTPPVVKSKEEKQLEREEKQAAKREEMKNNYEMLSRNLENVNAQSEAYAEAAKIQLKCMKIATRIMAGDDVPKADHRFLAEHAPELYGRAIMMRVLKENPEKHRQLSEDKNIIDEIGEIMREAVPDIPAAAAVSADTEPAGE